MRAISVVATMILALLFGPSLADAQQTAPEGPFDVLVAKWTGIAQERGQKGGAKGLTSFEMVIEKIDSEGNISGKFLRSGNERHIGTWKAEKKGNAIHIFFESKKDQDSFTGQLVTQDQIDGTWHSTNIKGRTSSERFSFNRIK